MNKRFKRVYIEITNVCNLSCSFCPKTNRKPNMLSVKEFTKIIHEVKNCTDYIYFHVKGEPLLHPDLREFLNICEKERLKVTITTNGTMLEAAWAAIKDAKALRQINISLHSFDSCKDMNFNTYMNMIIDKAKYFGTQTNIKTSLRLWNLDSLQEKAMDRQRNLEVLHKLEAAFSLDEKLTGSSIGSHGIQLDDNIYLNSNYEFQWPSLGNKTYTTTGTCYGLRNQIGILSDGTVIPCCLDGDGVVTLGNILETTLLEILQSKRCQDIIVEFQNHLVTEELCKHCSFRDRFTSKV